jgi:hypothetical protein
LDWPPDKQQRVRENLTVVFGDFFELRAFGGAAQFMAQMDISERDPLMLAYIPPWFTLWTNIGGIGSSGTYLFYQRYFDESPSWQLWNGYHELAHKWDNAQGDRLSRDFDAERRIHGVDPNKPADRSQMIVDLWYYLTPYAKDNWDKPAEDWAEMVAWIVGGMLPVDKLLWELGIRNGIQESWNKRNWVEATQLNNIPPPAAPRR